MRPIRLNLEALEDRTMPSTLGAMPPALMQNLQSQASQVQQMQQTQVSILGQQFGAMIPLMQQHLQNEINVAANLVKMLPAPYQGFAAQPLAQAQAFVNAFPSIAWNWFSQQVGAYEQFLLGQDAGGFPLQFLLSQAPSAAGNGQLPPHPQSGLSRVWTFGGTALDTSQWIINNVIDSANVANQHQNYSDPSHVVVNNGYLQMLLTQQNGRVGSNPQGVISTGALLHTRDTFGYGTYEFCVRVGSTASSPLAPGSNASGSLSGMFNYINNSQTEIDMETYGNWSNYLNVATFKNPDPSKDVSSADSSGTYFQVPGMSAGFQVYKFVWTPTDVTFYVNNQYEATLHDFVGSTPAPVCLAFFGLDSPTSPTSVGTNQYMYVQWVRYTAPGDTPLPVPTGG